MEHLCDSVILSKSESVYLWLCQNIGTKQQVDSRRDIMDIEELFNKLSSLECKRRICGSIREGFTLKSDVDFMNWYEKIKVIWNFSQAESYENHIFIYADSSESPPGYSLLFLTSEKNCDNDLNEMLSSASIQINGKKCLSSSKLRQDDFDSSPRGSAINGPCLSETLGHIKYDFSTCLASDILPPFTASWVHMYRCLSWPPADVVRSIVKNGCHFVPIGHKLGNHKDNEWRISFAVSEYELVRSMNHTQFLTYGWLKLMLDQQINKKPLCNEHKLLCSYHIKTVVFWAIQQNTLHHWCPQTLLAGFWICFKLLLKWVYEGVCPNFFIPENNMFKTKMHGVLQQRLFRKLYRWYENGIDACPPIKYILCDLTHTNRIDENSLISEHKFDAEFFKEVDFKSEINISSLHDFNVTEKVLEQLINLPFTQYEIVMLQRHVSSVLQSTAFILQNVYSSRRNNKLIYNADKVSCQMLKLATKWGFLSDILYFAMYYYKTYRYREALSLLEIAKTKLDSPYVLYVGKAKGNPKTVDGLSLSMKMRRVVIGDIRLKTDINYINELIPEQTACYRNLNTSLRVPHFVIMNMLTFLCSRHVETFRAKSALNALKYAVEHVTDTEHYGRISYEILGLSQEIAGNKQDALNSYYKSLQQFSLPLIQSATRQRIRVLRRDLRRSQR